MLKTFNIRYLQIPFFLYDWLDNIEAGKRIHNTDNE